MKEEKQEIIEKPKRFVCVQIKGSDKVTVIDVCDFIKKANENHAKTQYDYAEALLKSTKYFNNMEEANAYMAEVLQKENVPAYSGTEHIVCEEGNECRFLIHSINHITESHSTHEIDYAVFSAEVDISGQLVFPLFLHFEKTRSLFDVTKEDNKKEFNDKLFEKLSLLKIDNEKDDLFKKTPRPSVEPPRREQIRYEQEMDR